MMNTPITVGSHAHMGQPRATPLTGVMIGTAISLLLWALILAVVFIV